MNDNINSSKKTKALKELEKEFSVPDELRPENIEKMLKENQKADMSENKTAVKKVIIALVSAAACAAMVFMGVNAGLSQKNMLSTKETSNSSIIDISEFDNLQVLSDYSEINRILKEKKNEILNTEEMLGIDMIPESSETVKNQPLKSKAGAGGEEYGNVSSDHSETYTQVDGIDEADAIKTDGGNVYYILNGKLYFAKLNNEQVDVVKRLKFSSKGDFHFGCLYLSENILTAVYSDYSDKDNNSKTYVKSYDVSDISSIKEISSFSQDGQYNDSRMKDNNLYLVTDYSPYYYEDIDDIKNADKAVPSYECEGKKKCLEPSDIYKPMGEDYLDYSIVSGLDVTKENMCISSKAYMNTANAVYMNDDNIYISFVDYSSYVNSRIKFGDYSASTKTNVIRFSVSDGNVKLTAGKRISGSVLDRYSMDEYNGYFRIAVTSQNKKGEDKNSILIFNKDFKKTGEITDIAKGESIKSAIFEGDRAYVVTYEQTDPLFTFDLSDPSKPEILSELKALGYSTHLRAFKDSLMIGFGVDADKDGFETGLKLSMYKKNSNGKTTEVDTISFGDYNSEFMSDAVYDPKALLIDGEKNIVAFPFIKYNYDMDSNIRGFKVLSFDNDKFTVRKTIKVDTSYVSFETARIIYSGDYLYAFADNTVTVLNLNTFKTVNTVDLNESIN